MEKNWADFGYPVDVDVDLGTAEPMPKRIKVEQEACDNDEDQVVVNVAARIEILEKQWLKHFGDLQTSEPQGVNSKESSGSEAASSTPSNGPPTEQQTAWSEWWIVQPSDNQTSADAKKNCQTNKSQKPARQKKVFEYKCPLCPESGLLGILELFSKIEALRKHMKVSHAHHGEIFPCLICGMIFIKVSERRSHNRATHYHTCGICRKVLQHENDVEEHLLEIHQLTAQDTTCPECGERFLSRSRSDYVTHVLEHEKTSGKKLLFLCSICPKLRYFISDTLRLEHEAGDHNYGCVHCGVKLTSNRMLQIHIRKEHKNKPSPPQPPPQQAN